jgi:hypothetical protein
VWPVRLKPSDPARDERALRGGKHARAHAGSADGHGDLVLEIKPRNRLRTLNRWLLVVVPIVVVATIAWSYRQHVRQGYPLIIEKGRKEGIPALEEGEFDKANQLLSAAKNAVDSLGGDVQDADTIRDAALEAAVFVNLIPLDLGELLAEAGRLDTDTWESKFQSLYKGRSIIVDTIVVAAPDGTSASKFELALRILPPGEANNREGRPDRYGEFDLSGFQLFELARPDVGNRVVFGAKLESFKYDEESGRWLVRLLKDSGVFITHTKALDALAPGWHGNSLPIAEEPKEERP